jgi:hypothetical protein
VGVHGTWCQLCGLPTQHDHYVHTSTGMLKIYRGSSVNGGHRWDPGERPFPFGPDHAWLKEAVVLPWDDDRVLRGPIEDGAIEDGDGESVLVFDGGEDGLAFHRFCWELQGSPPSTDPAVRANHTHGWALVESYQEQLFDFDGLAADGKAWMLADPEKDDRSRRRIEAILAVARNEVTEAATTLEEIVAMDRDWSCRSVRDETDARKSLVRARLFAIENVSKAGFGSLVRVTRSYEGRKLPAEMAELEAFELDLKAAVEAGAEAVLAVVGMGGGRAEYLVYARDPAKTRDRIGSIPGAHGAGLDTSEDPEWAAAAALIRSLR